MEPKFLQLQRTGELEDREVELNVEQRSVPVQIFSNMGLEQMDVDFQNMFEKMLPKQNRERRVTVREARKFLLEQEIEGLMDRDAIAEEAVSCMMGNDRIHDHEQAGAEVMVAGDMSCLMHMQGLISRQKKPLKTMHIAQILAGRALPK